MKNIIFMQKKTVVRLRQSGILNSRYMLRLKIVRKLSQMSDEVIGHIEPKADY